MQNPIAAQDELLKLEALLKDDSEDIDNRDWLGVSCLEIAIFHKDIELAKLMLKYGADINDLSSRLFEGKTPLTLAYSNYFGGDSEPMVRFLLEHGALPNTNKWPGWVKKCYVAYKRFKLNRKI